MKKRKISQRILIAVLTGTMIFSLMLSGCSKKSKDDNDSDDKSTVEETNKDGSSKDSKTDKDGSSKDSKTGNDTKADDYKDPEYTFGKLADSGTLGDNIKWELDENGLLVISGSGDMPDYDYDDVESIPWYDNGDVKNIIVKNGITGIGNYSFGKCEYAESIIIPASVKRLGENAFWDCNDLKSFTIPESITSLEYQVFYGAGLESIVIPDSVTSIGDGAFNYCRSLTSVSIPDSVTSIGESAFDNCDKLTEINVPASVKSIGELAFSGCKKLAEIKIDQNNTEYTFEDGVLYDKNKTKLLFVSPTKSGEFVIPDTVTSIGVGAFTEDVKLKNIIFPNSVTSMDTVSFYGCRGLKRIILPESMTNLGYSSFAFCTNLKSIYVPDSVTTIEKEPFGYCENLTIYGNSGSAIEAYAKENDIPFVIGMPPETNPEGVAFGDIDLNDKDLHFFDDACLLSIYEEKELDDLCKETGEKINTDFIILSVDEYKDPVDTVKDVIQKARYGEVDKENCNILFVCMGSRNINIRIYSVAGSNADAKRIDDDTCQSIYEQIAPFFTEERYYYGIKEYIELVEKNYQEG